MIQQWYKTNPANLNRGMDMVRIGVALIILMHPLHGYTHIENIPRFGEFLTSLGYPFGTSLAWLVLLLQTACSLALLANRLVVPACLGHIVVICFGLIHVHAQYGWYVVGPGQGGMEWGFILLSSLLGIMWAYWPKKR
ncbi:MAG: DoxX family protein [Undibacterium umbellatum]|uniref:DoxX family protein n=1 Tax=Undibacterium umbellatum TaxID=2762300 RepID=UPI003BB690E2